MTWKPRLRHLPARMAVGAFILNSGLTKRQADEQTAQYLHGAAAGTYPFLSGMDARAFTRLLSTGEITVGTALLIPFVPTALAASMLAGFSGGLLGLYLRTPGMRRPRSLRPSEEGIAMAKDVWMFGIALTMLADSAADRTDAS